jgi:hypothetical protein
MRPVVAPTRLHVLVLKSVSSGDPRRGNLGKPVGTRRWLGGRREATL